MKVFDKVRIQTALGKRNKVNLDCRHTTTSDFFQLNIPYIRRMIPNEKIDIDVSAFSRLAGMPLPTFGDANLNLRCFFVPYRMVFKGFLDLLGDVPRSWSDGSTPSIPSHVPLIKNRSLVHALTLNGMSIPIEVYSAITLQDGEVIGGSPASNIPLSSDTSIYSPFIDPKYLYSMDAGNEGRFVLKDGSVFLYAPNSTTPTYTPVTYTLGEYGKITFNYGESSPYDTARLWQVDWDAIELDYQRGLIGAMPFDFELKDTSTSSFTYPPGKYHFLSQGRTAFKILRQLGYSPYFDLDTEVAAKMDYFSALDLLCWLKVWLDYYFPAQYYGAPLRTEFESIINKDTPDFVLEDEDEIRKIFQYATLVTYASDFVTAAFDNPVAGELNSMSAINIQDKTIEDGADIYSSSSANNGTPTINGYDGDGTFGTGISQFAITALRKLTDYVRRNQLVGSRAVDRLLARFNIKLDNNQVNRSFYLGSHHVPMVIGDVMSTADTTMQDGAALGDYAGKGFLVGQNGHFEFDSGKDFGLLIITSSIIPNTATWQGYDIFNFKTTKLDFFTPEFDALSTRAIEKGEVVALGAENIAGRSNIRDVYGFFPTYGEYKIPYNRLTGDFNNPALNQAGFTSDAWHLFRNITLGSDGYSNLVHSMNMVFGNDWSQYLRVFYNMAANADHFVLNYIFKVESYLPAKPLYDMYEFEHEEGAQIDMAVNGKRVN